MKGTKVTEMVETTMATTTVRKTEITELTVTAMNCSNFGNPGESFRVRRVQCNPARFHLWNNWSYPLHPESNFSKLKSSGFELNKVITQQTCPRPVADRSGGSNLDDAAKTPARSGRVLLSSL